MAYMIQRFVKGALHAAFHANPQLLKLAGQSNYFVKGLVIAPNVQS